MRTEFVVIGGGLTGLATAWALRRRGREAVVLEQAQIGHRDCGSHGACRIFRLGYDDPGYVVLAARSRQSWAELEDACGERLLHPAPQLTFGPKMLQVQAAMSRAGVDCALIPAGAAAERFPGVAVAGQVLLEPESAVIAADRTLAVLAALAGGVQTEVRVTDLADDGRRVRVRSTAGKIEAGRVIVCAGPWTARLLATAGITMPGSATLEQAAYLGPAGAAEAPVMPIFVHYGGEFPYGLPVPGSDRYKVGVHHGGTPVHPDHQDHADDARLGRQIEQAARTFLPGLDPRPRTVERCIYDNSPDTDFIIDRIGNVMIGSGTSGHGFKFGPLLGEWLASLACSSAGAPAQADALPEIPARFRLSRF